MLLEVLKMGLGKMGLPLICEVQTSCCFALRCYFGMILFMLHVGDTGLNSNPDQKVCDSLGSEENPGRPQPPHHNHYL